MSWILIETVDRESEIMQFDSLLNAQTAMLECFTDVLSTTNCVNLEDEIKYITEDLHSVGYYEDSECGIYSHSGWFIRRSGTIDWSIHEIKDKYSLEDEDNQLYVVTYTYEDSDNSSYVFENIDDAKRERTLGVQDILGYEDGAYIESENECSTIVSFINANKKKTNVVISISTIYR